MTGRACAAPSDNTRRIGRQMAARQSGLCPGQPWARARGMSHGTLCTSIHACNVALRPLTASTAWATFARSSSPLKIKRREGSA
eukprot:6688415-Pyramimonas_sp.AAC.1